MRSISQRRGFSLVELLTVIAIIAILAAIIFPVMATVKERARQNQCMTNLHQIAMGIKLFKTDNRRYPEMICGVVYDSQTNQPVIMENAKSDAYLFAEYVKSWKVLHCPSSKVISTAELITVPTRPWEPTTDPIQSYAYSSYDAFSDGTVSERRYCLDWASDTAYIDANAGTMPPADPAATSQQDFERQLKFRNPPEDTVVTWCSFHENRSGTAVRGRALVIFLDGSAEAIDAARMESSKWRMRPSKG